MNTPSWMIDATHRTAAKAWSRRGRGRRAGDRHRSLAPILGVVLAWAWVAYELALLFLR
jgi:hypothetical protein